MFWRQKRSIFLDVLIILATTVYVYIYIYVICNVYISKQLFHFVAISILNWSMHFHCKYFTVNQIFEINFCGNQHYAKMLLIELNLY